MTMMKTILTTMVALAGLSMIGTSEAKVPAAMSRIATTARVVDDRIDGTRIDRNRLADVMARLQMDMLVARISRETGQPKLRPATRIATTR